MFRSLPVVPVVDDVLGVSGLEEEGNQLRLQLPQNRGKTQQSLSSQQSPSSRPSKQWVTITFDDATGMRSCSVGTNRTLVSRLDDREQVGDVYIKRVCYCYPTWARKSSSPSGWDSELEAKFGQLRYSNFQAAFMHGSFMMMVGVLGLAGFALSQNDRKRAFMLACLVAPCYLFYGLYVLRRRYQYLMMSGTVQEKVLVALLGFQMNMIIWSDWVRPDFDYGLLVMHMGFVHNFTPLGAGVIQVVTVVCGLLPYIALKVVRFNFPDWRLYKEESAVLRLGEEKHCKRTAGTEELLLRILVPIVIFIYQVVVTMKRDESLRMDLLSRLNLVMQQRLLDAEKDRNEGLLSTMLPRKVIQDLKQEQCVEPQHFEDVTIIFVEICHFDNLCAKMLPTDVVEVLNIIYLEFDRLSDLLQVYKVETVGQVYMAVVGCPEPMVNHADVAAHFALAVQRSMRHIRGRIFSKLEGMSARDRLTPQWCPQSEVTTGTPTHDTSSVSSDLSPSSSVGRSKVFKSKSDINVVIHVGLNSGPIRAGIVGIEAPRYKLFGDTVNTASRMESTCDPGRIQVSHKTLEKLTKGMFQLEDRGEIPVKGKGYMRTAYLCEYAEPSEDSCRRVLIEHGAQPVATSSTDNMEISNSHNSQKERRDAWIAQLTEDPIGSSTLSIPEEDLVPSSDTSKEVKSTRSNSNSFHGFPAKKTNTSTMALMSMALGVRGGGQSTSRSRDLDFPGQHELSGKASMYAEDGEESKESKEKLGWLDCLQLLFLMVPAQKKKPHFLAELRRNLPVFQRETHGQRLRTARNLTMIWLLILSILGAMDYFMDALEEDAEAYRTAIIFRTLGNSITGLAYLLLLLVPAVSRWAQLVTIVMLALQGVALLACSVVLYNSELAIIVLYGAYILFYTVCTVLQRLMLCLAAVTGYVCIQYMRCGLEGLSEGADNIAFLVVFIASMACSVRLQEYLQHVSHWEQVLIERRLEEIKMTKAASSQLLTKLLPPHVVPLVGENVMAPLGPIAEHHSDVTILFTDIKGFTAYSSKISARELVHFLNSMYSAFDEIITNWALHKVEIIGDAYFVSAGCPPPPDGSENDPSENAMRAVEVGLALLRTLPTVCDDTTVQMRVGLHTGSVVAGVVGKKGPRYHLFGSTVAYAEKMESHGIPGKVQVSDATHALLRSGDHNYDFEERQISVEGEEGLRTTWVVNRSNSKAAFQIQKRLMSQRRAPRLGGRVTGGRQQTPGATSSGERATPPS